MVSIHHSRKFYLQDNTEGTLTYLFLSLFKYSVPEFDNIYLSYTLFLLLKIAIYEFLFIVSINKNTLNEKFKKEN